MKAIMSRRSGLLLITLIALIVWDVHTHRVSTFFVSAAESLQEPGGPLQVDGLPVTRPGTLTLGQGNPAVAIAASIDEELEQSAPLDVTLDYEQVNAIVRRALDLDQSSASIRDVIEADDWVVIKVNSVTNRGNTSSAYFDSGFEHPGQITDLRVVKSVVQYLIDTVKPRRITIAEGGAESPRRGESGFPTSAEDDTWSAVYPEFGGLSYIAMLEEFASQSVETVVDTSDLNYAPFRQEPVPGGAIQRLGVQRLTYSGAQFGSHVEDTGDFRTDGYFMPEPILDADKVISISAMKTTIYGTTLGIKNYVGTLASGAYGDGTSKRQHYQNNPEHGYVDLFSYNPAAYTVIEGFWGPEGDGPQCGQNVQHNVVVAGHDPVATESVANVTMGFNPLDLEALYLAAARGFGTLDLRRIRLQGHAPESVQRDFIKSRGGSGNGNFYGRGIRRWLVAGPFAGDTLDDEFLADEAGVLPMEGKQVGDTSWIRVEHLGYSAEILDLGAVISTDWNTTNYAFTLVNSAHAQDGFLWIGYDERARVRLNGEVVFDDDTRRRFTLAGEPAPIRLLFKIANLSGETMLAAHVVDEDGDRLPGIEFILPGEIATTIEEEPENDVLPESAALLGNYPNPFNPFTSIRFVLPEAAQAQVLVYNTAGQRIRTLIDEPRPRGYAEVEWDGRDVAGDDVASGVYLAVLRVGNFREARTMVLVR